MSGINTSGVHTANDYQLGRGVLYMADLDANGRPKGYRDLGNVPNVSCSVSKETLAHYSVRSGLKVQDKRVTTQITADLKFTLEDINFNNLALFYSGETAKYAGLAISALTTGVGNQRFVEDGDLISLMHYQLRTAAGDPVVGLTPTNAVMISEIAEGTSRVLTLNVDYTIDYTTGLIFLLSTTKTEEMVTAGHGLRFSTSADASASTVDQLKIMSTTELNVALMFILEDADSGLKTSYFYHKCSAASDGDYTLVSDEWAQLPMTASIELSSAYTQPGDVYFVTDQG